MEIDRRCHKREKTKCVNNKTINLKYSKVAALTAISNQMPTSERVVNTYNGCVKCEQPDQVKRPCQPDSRLDDNSGHRISTHPPSHLVLSIEHAMMYCPVKIGFGFLNRPKSSPIHTSHLFPSV